MDDDILDFGSKVFEIGLPIVLLGLLIFRPSARARAIVILGAIIPFIGLYLETSWAYFFSSDEDVIYAYGAMWLMSFWPFVLCFLIAVGLSFLKRPKVLWGRFMLGLAAPVFLGLLIAAGF